MALSFSPLTARQAEESRKVHGDNTLPQADRPGFWRQFFASFGDPIIKILLAALGLNLVVLFRNFDWFEACGIAVAILLATLVSTLSERGSEAAFDALQAENAKLFCRVERARGLLRLPITEVVVGDLVRLSAGERVPADGVLIEGTLSVDQSALNGESKSAKKQAGIPSNEDISLSCPCRLFRGSVVQGGEGILLVKAVGAHTVYGKMAHEMQTEERDSPLKVRLTALAKILSRIGYIAAGAVACADFCVSLWQETGGNFAALSSLPLQLWLTHLLHAATLAITVVVVAVPEGLPMMITVVLSANMRRMLKDHVLVRKLVGIETSGSLNILFTDKTGTLTKGTPEVALFCDGDGNFYRRRADIAHYPKLFSAVKRACRDNTECALTADGVIVGGNATDRALFAYVLPKRGDAPPKITRRIPFDSARKWAATEAFGTVLIKGAPEKLLPLCADYINTDGERCPLESGKIARRLQMLTESAMRVLLLAQADTLPENGLPKRLTLVGLCGIRDDLRPEIRHAVRTVQNAGVQVVMMTGDNKETARVLAEEAGILRGEQRLILTGDELHTMDDPAVKEALPRLAVVARALPSDKTRLATLAQECGLVTGMTGDGLNDAPALKKADVGFAMGSGTEVAKEAGDIVILNDDFRSIGKAILYGRTIFMSIRKFLVFQLTMNFCAVGVSLLGPFIGVDAPVTVMQMLWINMIMDTLAGLAFAGEPPEKETMQKPPKRLHEPIISKTMCHQIFLTGGYTVALCLLFLKLPLLGFSPDAGSAFPLTAFFALFVFSGIFNSLNARTERLWLFAHLSENKAFVWVMSAVFAVQIALIYLGGTLFRTQGLSLRELILVMVCAFTVVPFDLLRKWWLRRKTA